MTAKDGWSILMWLKMIREIPSLFLIRTLCNASDSVPTVTDTINRLIASKASEVKEDITDPAPIPDSEREVVKPEEIPF